MKQTLVLLAFALVSGCGSQDEKPDPAIEPWMVGAEVDGWLSAYARAEATKTHASGEHPAAEAEMSRRELALLDMFQRQEDEVNKVFSKYLAGCDREKEQIIQKRNQIQVVGRTLTPEEKKFVDETGPRILEEISARARALRVLKQSLEK